MLLLFKIISEYSLWFIPLCMLIGVLYGTLLYWHDYKNNSADKRILLVLFGIRSLVVALLAFLLLSPFIQTVVRYIQKPIIVIAADNSESILLCNDTVYYNNQYSKDIQNLADNLNDDYDVRILRFGSQVDADTNFDFSSKTTNYSTLFTEIKDQFENKNIGAIVLATDGIYTTGASAEYAFSKQQILVPVYTLALGDTLPSSDLFITDVACNKIAFQGNSFPIRVRYKANSMAGNSVKLRIIQNKKIVAEQQILIRTNDFFGENTFLIPANDVGAQVYTIVFDTLYHELSKENNQRVAIVEVLKSKQKILIVSDSPHPDIAALRAALSSNANYAVDVKITDNFAGKIEDYNLVILYQIPSKNSSAPILKEILKNEIPIVLCTGARSDFSKINTLNLGIQVEQKNMATDEVLTSFNKSFELFELDQSITDFVESAGSLIVPYGNYTMNFDFTALAFQNVGAVKTQKPIIAFGKVGNQKVGYILGEGLWRMRMYNYRHYSDFAMFDELINKIAGFMALKEKRSNFIVTTNVVVNENESVEFAAELYNESYELINQPDVSMLISNADGKEYKYTFNKTAKSYELNIGMFPVGNYSYIANVTNAGKQYMQKGAFVVVPVTVESYNTLANHAGLYKLAQQSSGSMFYPREIDSVATKIRENNQIVAISELEEKLKELISLPIFFILILTLLSVEWFFRKYFL